MRWLLTPLNVAETCILIIFQDWKLFLLDATCFINDPLQNISMLKCVNLNFNFLRMIVYL